MDHPISNQLKKTSHNESQTTVNGTDGNSAEAKKLSTIERCPPELRLRIYRELLHVTLHQEPEAYTKVKPFHLEVLWMNKKIRTEALHFFKTSHTWIRLAVYTSSCGHPALDLNMIQSDLPKPLKFAIESQIVLNIRVGPAAGFAKIPKDAQIIGVKYVLVNHYRIAELAQFFSARLRRQNVSFDFQQLETTSWETYLNDIILPLTASRDVARVQFTYLMHEKFFQEVKQSMEQPITFVQAAILGMFKQGKIFYKHGNDLVAIRWYDMADAYIIIAQDDDTHFMLEGAMDASDYVRTMLHVAKTEAVIHLVSRTFENDTISANHLGQLATSIFAESIFRPWPGIPDELRFQYHLESARQGYTAGAYVDNLNWFLDLFGRDSPTLPTTLDQKTLFRNAAAHAMYANALKPKHKVVLGILKEMEKLLDCTRADFTPELTEVIIDETHTWRGDPRFWPCSAHVDPES